MSRVYNTGETDESLKSEYNPEGSDLRRAQLRMLEMLVFLDRICKENNLEYILGDGTLLGAVRHGGYIPWDDDLDVYMPAGDINRLAKIVNSGDYDFVVQTHQSDKGFVRQCAVLRDLKSEYIKSEFVHNQRKYRGLQIDLFQYGFGVNGSLKHLIHKITWKNENISGRISSCLPSLTECADISLFRYLSSSVFSGVRRQSVRVTRPAGGIMRYRQTMFSH